MAGYSPEQDDDDVIAQINIIPFVDIVLVLLIIFLLTSNLIARAAIPVDLPRAASANESVGVTINIVLTATGELFLDGNAITPEALTTRVAQQLKVDPGLRAVIAADKAVRYEYVVQRQRLRAMRRDRANARGATQIDRATVSDPLLRERPERAARVLSAGWFIVGAISLHLLLVLVATLAPRGDDRSRPDYVEPVHDRTLTPQYRGKKMATTVVACALRHDQAIVSHVGDSRCYLVRNGKAKQITQDQTRASRTRTRGMC